MKIRFYLFRIPKAQLSSSSIKIIEGVIMFDPRVGDYPMPQDIVFIPFKIDKKNNLENNVKIALEIASTSYFMYFQNMRHTQPFIFAHLDSLSDNADTAFCSVRSSLLAACKDMQTIEMDAIRFPGLGAAVDCKVKVSLGKIIFKEGEPYLSDANSQSKRSQQHQFSLALNNQHLVMNYKNDGRYFGLAVAFLPIVLSTP